VVGYGTSSIPGNLSYIDYTTGVESQQQMLLLKQMAVLLEQEPMMDLYMEVKCIL